MYGRFSRNGQTVPTVYGREQCTEGTAVGGYGRCTEGVRSVVCRCRLRLVFDYYFLASSAGLRLVFASQIRLTLAPWARVSPYLLLTNNPSATASGVRVLLAEDTDRACSSLFSDRTRLVSVFDLDSTSPINKVR